MSDFETEHVKESSPSEMDDSDRLLYEMVVRLSALEAILLKKGIIAGADLAEAQIGCMQKIKEVIDNRDSTANSQPSGFIKHGEAENV